MPLYIKRIMCGMDDLNNGTSIMFLCAAVIAFNCCWNLCELPSPIPTFPFYSQVQQEMRKLLYFLRLSFTTLRISRTLSSNSLSLGSSNLLLFCDFLLSNIFYLLNCYSILSQTSANALTRP